MSAKKSNLGSSATSQLVVNSYLNMPYFDGGENHERMTEILKGLGFMEVSPTALETLAGRIGSTMTAKSEGIGSPCGGVIDRGYLDVEQVLSNGIIVTVESMEKHSNRSSVPLSPYLRGFTVIKFKKQLDGNYYLYIDVICANDPKRLGIANALWRQVFLAAGNLRDAGLINGIQLSSLTYVVAYYFGKVGFKFYNIDNTGEQTLDRETNAAALELSKWRFDDDDKNELLVVQQGDESWYDYAMRLAGYDDEVSSGFIDARDQTKLRDLLRVLNDLQKHPNRRESLASRYSAASQITDLLNKINEKGEGYDENSSPTVRFMEIASRNGHSAELGRAGFRAPASKRDAGGSEDYDDVLDRFDPGAQGWTMFLIGEDFSKLRAKYDSMAGGARKKKGGNICFTKKCRDKRRLKKDENQLKKMKQDKENLLYDLAYQVCDVNNKEQWDACVEGIVHKPDEEDVMENIISLDIRKNKSKIAPPPGLKKNHTNNYRPMSPPGLTKKNRKQFVNQQAGKRRRRKTRKRRGGMYSVSERNRLKNLEKNIPFSLLVKTKNMSPKQKVAAFKKVGIKKKDLQGIAQMRNEEMIEKNALRAHREMMQMEARKNKSLQAGGKKRKTRKNRRKKKSKRNKAIRKYLKGGGNDTCRAYYEKNTLRLPEVQFNNDLTEDEANRYCRSMEKDGCLYQSGECFTGDRTEAFMAYNERRMDELLASTNSGGRRKRKNKTKKRRKRRTRKKR